MSGFNGGRGRGRAVRNDAGRGEPQPTPQYDPAHQNYESNSFTGMFGGFLDPTQPFGNYYGSMNEQPPVQQPFVGAGMQRLLLVRGCNHLWLVPAVCNNQFNPIFLTWVVLHLLRYFINSLALLVHISTVISLWGNPECQVTQCPMKGYNMKA